MGQAKYVPPARLSQQPGRARPLSQNCRWGRLLRRSNSMKILVTGGAGFIGSHIVDALLRDGHEVRILDNLEKPTHQQGIPDYLSPEAEFMEGDVRRVEDLRKALDGMEVVFHEAATGGFTPNISTYIDSNILATARLLEVIRDERLPIKKIIVASSVGVYGEGKYNCPKHGIIFPHVRMEEQLKRRDWELRCPSCSLALKPLPTDEMTPVRPEKAYSVSKFSQERLVLSIGMELGIPAVALRYFLTYGPRQSLFNPYTGVCSIFSTMILNGMPPVIFEDGWQTRDFVFVEDVARANLLVMKDPRANFRVFNVGTGRATAISKVVEILSKAYKRKVQPRIGEQFRLGEVRHLVADITQIAQLGFAPQVPFEEGIRRYVDWISSQGNIHDYFTAVEEHLRGSGVIRSCQQ
ncbi:MAG: NAD-dependent epimerase/dehydratase family protein [Candidatus Omnitrophica bacterium]|nr:NAD-dependent epimerase/dehydratase family protein [Candidatus Omnitrophota bacterium]